jgi:hypothetical protein
MVANATPVGKKLQSFIRRRQLLGRFGCPSPAAGAVRLSPRERGWKLLIAPEDIGSIETSADWVDSRHRPLSLRAVTKVAQQPRPGFQRRTREARQ